MNHISNLSNSEKAKIYLQMAQRADKEILSRTNWNEDQRTDTKFTPEEIEEKIACSKRLWNRYLVVKEKVLIGK